MSEISRLFARAPNSHSQTDLAEVLKFLATTGYKRNSLNDLEVIESSPAAMSVSLSTGKAWIEGYYYYNDAAKAVVVTAADGALNRIDRIILRCDYLTNLENTVEILTGTAAATPVAPSLTRAGGVYEISLAQIYVGAAVAAVYTADITDERDDASVCGVAQGLAVAKVSQLHSKTLPRLNGNVTAASIHPANSLYGLAKNGNDLYFVGGNTSPYNVVSKYSDDVWTTLSPITTPRRYGGSCSYYDGAVYCIGGASGVLAILDKNEKYTISTDTWSSVTAKTTASTGHSQVQLDGKIYCFSGSTAAAAAGDTILEIYNIAGDTWSTGTNLPSNPAVSGAQNRCFTATDGENIYISYYTTGAANVFLRYNVSSDSYTTLTNPFLTGPTDSYGALYYFNGDFYCWAGVSAYTHYNITTDTWTIIGVNPAIGTMVSAPTELLDNGVLISSTKHYTLFYYLGTAVAEYILGFRKNTDADLGFFNQNTLTAGIETLCVTIGDVYGIYVNDTSLTGLDYEVEVYG